MRSPLVLVVVVLLGGVGCGGGGDGDGQATFDETGFSITFDYPEDFKATDDVTVASQAGGSAVARKALTLDNKNLLLVTKYNLTRAVDESNVQAIKPEADNVVSQLAGEQVSGEQVEFGGLPGFEYTFALETPQGGTSRFVMLFDGKSEYTINCQWTPEKRAEIGDACEQALATLETK